jgi:hypothetical protein
MLDCFRNNSVNEVYDFGFNNEERGKEENAKRRVRARGLQQ